MNGHTAIYNAFVDKVIEHVSKGTTPLQAAKAFNKAHPPIVSLDRINQPGCPHHAICEDCGQEAGEHVRSLGSRKVRCLTPKEMRRERDRRDQNEHCD